jgi:hypothetical protein
MLIQIDAPLPCAQDAAAGLCAHPTTAAFISPLEGGAWEILPICPAHLQEADRPAHCHTLRGAVLAGLHDLTPLAPATAD